MQRAWVLRLHVGRIATCCILFNGGALWAFSSVFAASFSANIPLPMLNNGDVCDVSANPEECANNFRVWLALFAVIVVPLSLLELKEQHVIQVRAPPVLHAIPPTPRLTLCLLGCAVL